MSSFKLMLFASAIVSSAHAADGGELPPLDPASYQNLTEAVLECPNVDGAPIAGVRGCRDHQGQPGFKTTVLSQVYERLNQEIKLRYEGKEMVDWQSGETKNVPVPVCNVTAGEITQNKMGQSCGKPCQFTVSGTINISVNVERNPPSCDRERAYYYGARTQLMKYFVLQAATEFKRENRVRLSKLGGNTACHAMAADLMDIQSNKLNANLDLIVNKFGRGPASQLTCDRDTSNVSMQAPCNMEMIQARVASLWGRVIRCEGLVRAQNEVGEILASAEAMQDRATARLEPKCRGQYNADCVACTNGTRTNRLNQCYENETPGYFQEEFKKYDSQELESGLLKKDQNAMLDLSGGWALALGALARRRRRRKSASKWHMLLLVLACVASVVTAGCGCGEEEAEEQALCPTGASGAATPGICQAADEKDEDPIQSDFSGAAGDVSAATQTAETVQAEIGEDGVKAPPTSAEESQLSAEAVDKVTPESFGRAPSGGRAGGKDDSDRPSANVNLPKVAGGGSGNTGGGAAGFGGGAPSGSVEIAAGGGGGSKPTELTSRSGSFDTGGSGGGGSKPNGSLGLGGFGDGGPSVASASSVGFGNGTGYEGQIGGGVSMEAYLAKVGRLSLFEVINKRTEKFTQEIEASRSMKEFRKLAD